ncbi:hypothetical protein V6Z11_D04G016600 [Gossypium hirsutum]|uniref:Cysteine-rich and transmembrane domain-containing protein WIH1-like n=3 Tax=Gossypium TaxID=3633 RepID=A0ABM2ZY97_GOSHI|nr:cysteine-rich and transmembrane domain-containing protein WIH1-like [Gossypium hirsutum]TYG72380.1 hypothetical protein ES288_D04G016200v1 [Gossypium darwinii]TYH75422.1 hypothetical protein ES332_D04G017600v1 [Gossypium tomentosum]
MSDPKYFCPYPYPPQGYPPAMAPPPRYAAAPPHYAAPYPAQRCPPVMAPPPRYAAPPPRPGFLEDCLLALRCCCLIGECCADPSIIPVS